MVDNENISTLLSTNWRQKYFFHVNITSLTWIVLWWSGNSVIFSGIQLRSTHMCTKKKTNKSSGRQLTVFPRSWSVLWMFSKMSSKLKGKRLRSSSTLQDALRVYTCKSRVVWNICLQNEIINAREKNARVTWSYFFFLNFLKFIYLLIFFFVNLDSNKQPRTKTERSKCCCSRKS